MKLHERKGANSQPEEGPPAVAPTAPPSPAAAPEAKPSLTAAGGDDGPRLAARGRTVVVNRPTHSQDPMLRLKAAAAEQLFERLGVRLTDPNLDEATLHGLVDSELATIIGASSTPLTPEERRRIIHDVRSDTLGLGPLEPLLTDDTVTEIMVNRHDLVYIERAGLLERTDVTFYDDAHLRRIIERIVTRVGRRIDEASPLVDARLPDGSRVNAIIAPLAVSGSTLTIRKFSRDALTAENLVKLGTFTAEIAELLEACVQARLNILISGGTGTGKTTMLNILSSFIPENERIVTIEDAVELQLQQEHVVRLEGRPPNVEGKGEVAIRDLVRNSLRMRPDRIVVGETRGSEALDMLQAMNTGHDGSLTTLHSNSARDAIARLETLVLMAGMDLPLRAVREQIASAIDVIIQITRLRDGSRRVTSITEVQGMEGQVVTLAEIFAFNYAAGVDRDGRFLGTIQPTGVRPHFADRFPELGITVDSRVFGDERSWPKR